MNAQQEAHIISQVRAGNIEPFAELVRFYQHQLFRFVGNMVGRNSVEDVVQETFLAAFRNLWRFDGQRASFRTWLYRIARNQALNCLKKKNHETLQPEYEQPEVATPADQMMQKEMFMRLDRALADLKFRERSIFILADIEGLSYAQIARIEGVRLGTVKSRLSRARAKLKISIEDYLNHHEQ